MTFTYSHILSLSGPYANLYRLMVPMSVHESQEFAELITSLLSRSNGLAMLTTKKWVHDPQTYVHEHQTTMLVLYVFLQDLYS